MTAFKICFWSACLILFFSCKEKNELEVRTPGPSNKRLLGIKEVKRVIPNNSFMYYNSDNVPFFELTIQNMSNFELDYHYPKRLPFWAGPCMEYLDFPSTAGCLFIEDTSRVIKKNEEFIIRINPLDYNSQFHKYEYQGFKFQLLISSSNELSFYFEGNRLVAVM